jgi:DNA-binding IclR family transcriptional regulator
MVLEDQVKRARETGMATEFEEIRLGYGSLAVPVFGGDRMLAGALSITAPTGRLNVSRLTGTLRTAALGIGRKLQAIER